MADPRYSTSHEWCRLEDGVATCGITQHAIDELGDLTFLDFRVEAGEEIAKGDPFGEIDSVKATSEVFAPMSGTLEAINDRFSSEDELPTLQSSPMEEGWLLKIKVSDASQHEALMDLDAYTKYCAEH